VIDRISVALKDGDRERIEARIKLEYPRIKSVSQLVRAALEVFLEDSGGSELG